jgi:DNA-binding response OmpR family regulator
MIPAQSRGDGFLLLIADPDVVRAETLATELADHQVRTVVCADGAEALLATGAEQPDAVLAAARLPTVDGAALVRTLSGRTTIPVVLGIGDGDGSVAAEALAAGAAACVAHPYRMRELLPILRAIRPESLGEPQPMLECGALRLDPASLEVHLYGRPIRLPLRELRLLELLMRHPERVVTREQIHDVVWRGAPGSNTITVHVQRLRQRLGDDHTDPRIILTVRGVGYRLIPPPLVASPVPAVTIAQPMPSDPPVPVSTVDATSE